MNLRTTLTAALGCGAFLLLGCVPNPPPPVSEEVSDTLPGMLESYSADAKFDPEGRHFLFAKSYFQIVPAMATHVHRSYVEQFLRQPGAGFGRMELPVSPASHWVELVAESQADRHPEVGSGRAPVTYSPVDEMLKLPDGTRRSVRERVWQLRDRQLMSVSAETGPAVYLQTPKNQHELMKPKTGATAPKRPLDAFETEALAKLRTGDEVALQSSERELRVLGAILARQECLTCHSTAEVGTLLGAFTYTLNAQSEAIPDAHRLQDTTGLMEAELGAVKVVESRGGKVTRTPGGPVTKLQMTFAYQREIERTPHNPSEFSLGRNPPLRDSALAILGAFPDVRVLDVSHSFVSDTGLKSIAALKNLKLLDLRFTAVSEKGIAAFKKEVPQCEMLCDPVPVP